MKARKIRAVERRLFTRLYVPLPVCFRIVDLWSPDQSSMPIHGKTWNVSYEGLCIEADAVVQEGIMSFSASDPGKTVKVLPFLVMEEQRIDLKIELASHQGNVIASGKVVWSELKTTDKKYHLRIGVFLEEMAQQERERWNRFIQHVK